MSLERLESLRRVMKKCVRCSLCKLVPRPTIQQTKFISACPPVDEYHFHAYSGGGINVMALALRDGRIQVDHDLAQIVSACTTCGLCDVSCKFIMAAERQDVIIALKEHIVELGFGVTSKPEDKPTLLILDAAEALFIEQGFAAASLRAHSRLAVLPCTISPFFRPRLASAGPRDALRWPAYLRWRLAAPGTLAAFPLRN